MRTYPSLVLFCKQKLKVTPNSGAVVVVIVWYLDLQLPMQSVPIITKVVSSMHYYVIKLVSDLWQVGDFLQVHRFPPPIKLTVAI